MGRSKQNEVRTILNYTNQFSTTAATDYKGVINLTLSDSTEWTSLAALWDEVIVDSGRLEFTITQTTNFTTNNGANRHVLCFDPLDASSLGSLSNGLQHSQHMTFSWAQTTTGLSSAMTVPVPMNKNGVFVFHFRIPKGSARTAGSSAIFGHEWSSTGDASDVYGYLKWYLPTTGATGVQTVYWTWTLNCRFRART
jgi:hypothetical protein